MSDYKDKELLLRLLHEFSSSEIAEAMRSYAELQDEPNWHYECNGECSCGWHCGEDGDCFACEEHENLYELMWKTPEDDEVVSE